MKLVLVFISILLATSCLAQQKASTALFIEIIDQADTIHFEQYLDGRVNGNEVILKSKNYQLLDMSASPTGFGFYYSDGYIHKIIASNNHRLLLVKNQIDSMNIEIVDANHDYFLSIKFQEGNYLILVNDQVQHDLLLKTLPTKDLKSRKWIINISPLNWSDFQVNANKIHDDYSICRYFEKLHQSTKPIIPEDNQNFRNQRQINDTTKEYADYNFDGKLDYRERKTKDITKWNYFIFSEQVQGFVEDTLLSGLDNCHFDFEKKEFAGSKTIRVHQQLTQVFYYEFVGGKFTLVYLMECVHVFPNSERMDCSVFELVDGEMVFKELIKGCE